MILNSSEHRLGERYSMGSAEMRVGTDRTAMSLENKLVASGIVDGGFHEFESPTLGDVVNFRRVGGNPFWQSLESPISSLYLNEIRLYETVNLLKEQQGKINLTSDTSESLQSFEAVNLLQNLENRSSGGNKQSAVISPYEIEENFEGSAKYSDFSQGSAEHLDQNSCFKASQHQLENNAHRFIIGLQFEQPQFIHAVTLSQDMTENTIEVKVAATQLFQDYTIFIGNHEDYSLNQRCNDSPFQKIDDPRSYVFDAGVFDFENSDFYGMGKGMVWPFGAEHWCNLEGQYLHIVSDMSHLAGQDYETSICSLGVMGTRYIRDGEPLPESITLVLGESQRFNLEHIRSELDIGTVLAIDIKQSSGQSLSTITNHATFTEILIETDKSDVKVNELRTLKLDFSSYDKNSKSSVPAALKTDTILITIQSTLKFASDLPFETVPLGRVKHIQLPEILSSYPVISAMLEPQNEKVSDFLSIDIETRKLSFEPMANVGYESRDISGDQVIVINLFDERGHKSSFEMDINFFAPLQFSNEILPDLNVIAGQFASVELPEIEKEYGYSLQKLTVQPEFDILSDEIYYDPQIHAVVYHPQSNEVSHLKAFAGDSLITVTLVDTQDIEYKYEMNLLLTVPLYFADDLEPFDIAVGIASSIQLPEIVGPEVMELKEVILVPSDEKLAQYFAYNAEKNTIDYDPNGFAQDQSFSRKLDDDIISQYAGENLFQLKLVDFNDVEFVYDFSVSIFVCQFSIPITLTGPFSYNYYSDQVPDVVAMFENEKASPQINSSTFISYEPLECKDLVRFRCKVEEWGDCTSNDESSVTSFNERTGSLTFEAHDKVSKPPGFYYFELEAELGSQSLALTHVIQLVDPCSELELSLAQPRIFVDKNYFLHDPELRYDWTEESLIWKNTEISCGSLVVEIFMDDGSAIDENIFTQDQQAFIVPYTEDVSYQGLYQFRFKAYYDEQPDRFLEIRQPFKVGIINPCESSLSLTVPTFQLNSISQPEIVMHPAQDLTIPQFTADPAWCDVSYTYQVNSRQGHAMVKSWDSQSRTFSFQYTENFEPFNSDKSLESADFLFTIIAMNSINNEIVAQVPFTLRVINPCSEASKVPLVEQPLWCPSSPTDNMPAWIKELDDIVIYGDQKSTYNLYHLGRPVDSLQEPMLVTLDLGQAAKFASYVEGTNTLKVTGVKLDDAGEYRILLKAASTQDDKAPPIQKYLSIFINDVVDADHIEPHFESNLTAMRAIAGLANEQELPSIVEGTLGLKEVILELDELLNDQFTYDEEENKVLYEPDVDNMEYEQRTGQFITWVKLIAEEKDFEFVYEMQTILIDGGLGVDYLTLKAKADVRAKGEDIVDLEVIIPVICLILIVLVIICWRVQRSKLDKEYKVVQILDRASFGLVQEVKRVKDDKALALKQCLVVNDADQDIFEREMRLIETIDHPNIVQLEDYFIVRKCCGMKKHMCIVMELCQGGNLFEQIEVQREQEESIPEDKVLQMAAQLLDGLRYLHERKIVHRGIKPSSILLTIDENVKFGEFVSKSETRPYFSARKIQEEVYDERTDIFQLGCVLYFACAFVHPFKANDDQEVAAMQSSEIEWTKRIVDFPYKRIPEIYSNELNEIIARMLFQKKQENEPKAQNLLKEVLDHLQSRQPDVRQIVVQEIDKVHSGSRIAIQRHDQESGPHETEDQREDGSQTHRGLLNKKAEQSEYSNADNYQYADPFMRNTSSILLNDRRTFKNWQKFQNAASGGVQSNLIFQTSEIADEDAPLEVAQGARVLFNSPLHEQNQYLNLNQAREDSQMLASPLQIQEKSLNSMLVDDSQVHLDQIDYRNQAKYYPQNHAQYDLRLFVNSKKPTHVNNTQEIGDSPASRQDIVSNANKRQEKAADSPASIIHETKEKKDSIRLGHRRPASNVVNQLKRIDTNFITEHLSNSIIAQESQLPKNELHRALFGQVFDQNLQGNKVQQPASDHERLPKSEQLIRQTELEERRQGDANLSTSMFQKSSIADEEDVPQPDNDRVNQKIAIADHPRLHIIVSQQDESVNKEEPVDSVFAFQNQSLANNQDQQEAQDSADLADQQLLAKSSIALENSLVQVQEFGHKQKFSARTHSRQASSEMPSKSCELQEASLSEHHGTQVLPQIYKKAEPQTPLALGDQIHGEMSNLSTKFTFQRSPRDTFSHNTPRNTRPSNTPKAFSINNPQPHLARSTIHEDSKFSHNDGNSSRATVNQQQLIREIEQPALEDLRRETVANESCPLSLNENYLARVVQTAEGAQSPKESRSSSARKQE